MRLLDSFLADTIEPAAFDHRAHVVVGFEILRGHPLDEATGIYTRHLVALTQRAGVPDKFSPDITENAMRLISERMAGEDDADSFLANNPDLLTSQAFR